MSTMIINQTAPPKFFTMQALNFVMRYEAQKKSFFLVMCAADCTFISLLKINAEK